MNQQERQQFLAHWEKVRRGGVFQYIALTAFSWATFSAVVIRLVFILFEQGLSLEALAAGFISESFLIFWAVFLAGGCCYAATMWFFYQRLYLKLQRKAVDEAPSDSPDDPSKNAAAGMAGGLIQQNKKK